MPLAEAVRGRVDGHGIEDFPEDSALDPSQPRFRRFHEPHAVALRNPGVAVVAKPAARGIDAANVRQPVELAHGDAEPRREVARGRERGEVAGRERALPWRHRRWIQEVVRNARWPPIGTPRTLESRIRANRLDQLAAVASVEGRAEPVEDPAAERLDPA